MLPNFHTMPVLRRASVGIDTASVDGLRTVVYVEVFVIGLE